MRLEVAMTTQSPPAATPVIVSPSSPSTALHSLFRSELEK